jgi:hypothetical protein
MGTRTSASIEVYPFERAALSSTPAGQEFLTQYDAIVDWHEHDDPEITDGHLVVYLEEVNYGTAQFDNERLPTLATAAGLWYRDYDAGGGTWSPHRRTFFPNGAKVDFPIDETGRPLLGPDDCETIIALDSDVPLAGRLNAYYQLGLASLPNLAAKASDGSLARMMEAVGLKPVGPGDLERQAEASDLGPPEPPPPIRGPGSNQYEDKPPRPR